MRSEGGGLILRELEEMALELPALYKTAYIL
jgi:hypothetical protein